MRRIDRRRTAACLSIEDGYDEMSCCDNAIGIGGGKAGARVINVMLLNYLVVVVGRMSPSSRDDVVLCDPIGAFCLFSFSKVIRFSTLRSGN